MFIKKYSYFEFQLCCALCLVFCCCCVASSKRGREKKTRATTHKRQHRPACPPANAMGIHNGNAFAGTTANGLAVRRTPRRTTPACGAATYGSRPATPGTHRPIGDPLPLPWRRGGFSARRTLALATAARRRLRAPHHSQLVKISFLLISRVVFLIEISSCR